MMKILKMQVYEKYFARQIYGVFVFILFAVLALFIFFDMLSELGSVVGRYTTLIAFFHVMLQAPTRVYEVIPVAALISAIYVFSQMASQSEFTIFRVAGLDTRRALLSLFKIALPLALVTYVFGEFIGPKSEQFAQKVRLEALGATVSSGFRSGVWVKDRGPARPDGSGGEVTRFVNVGTLQPNQTIQGLRIYEFDANYRLSSIRVAQQARYQGHQHWELNDVTETRFIEFPRHAGAATPQDSKQAVPGAPDALAPDFRGEQTRLPKQDMRSELTPQILSVLMVTPDRMKYPGPVPVHPPPARQQAGHAALRDRAVEEGGLPLHGAGDDGAVPAVRLPARARRRGRPEGVRRDHAGPVVPAGEQPVLARRPAQHVAGHLHRHPAGRAVPGGRAGGAALGGAPLMVRVRWCCSPTARATPAGASRSIACAHGWPRGSRKSTSASPFSN